MKSYKQVKLIVHKPMDYKPIPEHEKKRVSKLITEELLEVANRFDGGSKIKIKIYASGNAQEATMELIDILANRLIEDLKDFNKQLEELKNVFAKNKRRLNTNPLPQSKTGKEDNDKISKRNTN